jgi:hypothetical protein
MKKPLDVRPLSTTEQHARVIAETVGCDDQTMGNAIQAFHARGLAALRRQSSAPHRTPHAVLTPARRQQLRALLHQSPRTFGQPSATLHIERH